MSVEDPTSAPKSPLYHVDEQHAQQQPRSSSSDSDSTSISSTSSSTSIATLPWARNNHHHHVPSRHQQTNDLSSSLVVTSTNDPEVTAEAVPPAIACGYASTALSNVATAKYSQDIATAASIIMNDLSHHHTPHEHSNRGRSIAMSNHINAAANVKHPRRFCREPGCTKIVKSQGLCQRHGAQPRKCKVAGCGKQAQGNFDGMCKTHFKDNKRRTTPVGSNIITTTMMTRSVDGVVAPVVQLPESVYDRVIPNSLTWDGLSSTGKGGGVMPLIAHLQAGFDAKKPPAWHRNEERLARGLHPIHNAATQLEGWERELVWMEILILTGNPQSKFRHLARAWGRDKGFHMVLAQFICSRRGDVQRKKRQRLEPGITSTRLTTATATDTHQVGGFAGGDISAKDSAFNATACVTTGARAATADDTDDDGDDSPLHCQVVGANVWDDTCYGDVAYNEALAAGLLEEFDDEPPSYNEDEKEVVDTQKHPGAATLVGCDSSLQSSSSGDDEEPRTDEFAFATTAATAYASSKTYDNQPH